MTVIHRVTFPASDAYKLDRTVFEPALKMIAQTDGYICSWHGVQNEVEGGELGYHITAWESYEHHKKLIESSSYPGIIASLKPALNGKLESHHFEITVDPNPAMSGKTTEVVLLSLKEGSEMADLVEVTKKLAKQLDEAKGSSPPCIGGVSIEEPTKILTLIGWESRQSHLDAVSEEPLSSTVGTLHKVADVTLTHVDLTKYTLL
ncbi:hypothetical protein C8J56DRAFT_173148 [Mycena floridula]|nr:hypothetical protein C8J56DRAFT_173148 [Mycena floridula]